MTPFLEQFAIDVYSKYKNDLADICIVMPSRRGQKYFIHYLNQHTKSTILLPDIFTIDEFASELSGLQKIDQTELLLILYKYHVQNFPDDGIDFKHFMGWASIFLKDISEIDMQLVDAKAVFTSLTEIKELSYYDLPEDQRSQMQNNYLRFFEQLYFNYEYLHQTLIEKSSGYQGLIFLKAHENLVENYKTLKWKKILFCGFNALTNSETKIIQKLQLENLAETYWDADTLYLNDELRDAGYFLRKAKIDFKLPENFSYESNYFDQNPKSIDIVGAPNAISQIKYAGDLIKKIQLEFPGKMESFVIVPADETLLPSLINTINPDEINITMGMPLTQSILHKLYTLIFEMHINSDRMLNKQNREKKHLYYKDVLAILSHPILNELASTSSKNSLKKACKHLMLQNIVYCNNENICKLDGIEADFFINIEGLFIRHDNPENLIKTLAVFNTLLIKNSVKNPSTLLDNFSKSALNYFEEIFIFLDELSKNYPIGSETDFLYSLFNNKVNEYSISFIGDALNGPQLMGLLETRLLDFDNVIMLSVNEDTLPTGKSTNSLLPFDLRKHFNLHSHNQKDAVFSYHFFRLLQRAKNITLIYNSDLKDGKSEKSRFINQLIYDIAPKTQSIQINESILNISPSISQNNEIKILKSKTVIELLQKIESISPSSLSHYIQCPLKFYFSSVVHVKESDEVTESTDDAMLGNVIHFVLDKIYKQFPINQKLNYKDFELITSESITPLIEEAYANLRENKIHKNNLKFGKNRLAFEVIKNYISDFLKAEIEQIKHNDIIPIGFEHKVELDLPISSNIKSSIRIKGFIDRLDSFNEINRIIDYKTGKVDVSNLKFSMISELFESPKLAKSLQLMSYCLLFSENDDFQSIMSTNAGIEPMIISFKSKEIYFNINYDNRNLIEINDILEFKDLLINIINEIFDTNTCFTQTVDIKQCDLCPYRSICGK